MKWVVVIMGKTPTMRPVVLLHTLYLVPQKVEDNVYSSCVEGSEGVKWKLGLETGIGPCFSPGEMEFKSLGLGIGH